MAYIFEVSFDIQRDELRELAIGGSLERVLMFLRARLPEQPGFISSQTLRTISDSDPVRVVVWSEWQDWETLLAHQGSALAEDKMLLEIDPRLKLEHQTITIYTEVA